MTQLLRLKRKLENPNNQDELLEDLLEDASNIICDIRNSNKVENKYLGTQIEIAVEMYNKIGAEGQISHEENGLIRGYEKGSVSDSLIKQITPVLKTPFSKIRVIE